MWLWTTGQKKSSIVSTMKQTSLILLVISVFFAIPVSTMHAETVLRTGSDISVEADQVVEGDYYVSVGPFGKTVMSGSVAEDMYALGASVTINGEIGHDVSIMAGSAHLHASVTDDVRAGSAHLHASVTDDVRIFAGEVTLADEIGGDVFVIAGSLSVLSTAKITGDIFFFGGNLSIEGDVEGSVLGKAQSVNIDSHIGGDIDMTAQAGMALGDTAVVDGFVRYTSFSQLTRGQDTVVTGEVTKSEYASITAREQTRDLLIPIFITLFATLSLYLLFKNELESLLITIENGVTKNILIGTGVVLLGPIVAVLLIVTVLGVLVGLMTLSIVTMLYVAGFALSSLVLGAYVSKIFTKKLQVTLVSILVGTVAMQLLLLIPILGILCAYTIFVLTVGGVTSQLYRHFA